MPTRPATYRPPRAPAQPPSETARPTASKRGYDYRWQRFRLSYLATNPLCVGCSAAGRVTAATCIDHIDDQGPLGPRGYDPTNLQALCHQCHSRKTVKQDGGLGRKPPGDPSPGKK